MNLKKKGKPNLRYKMLRTTRKNIKFEIKLRKQIRRRTHIGNISPKD